MDAAESERALRPLLPRERAVAARRAPASASPSWRRWPGAGVGRRASRTGSRPERAPRCGCPPRPCRALTLSLTGPYPGAASVEGMSARQIIRNVALAVAGLVAAVAIGLTANSISGDSVGLSAQPLSAGEGACAGGRHAGRPRRRAQRAQARADQKARTRTCSRRAGANDHHAGRAPTDGHDRRRRGSGDDGSSGRGLRGRGRGGATTTRATARATQGGDDNSGHGGGGDDD